MNVIDLNDFSGTAEFSDWEKEEYFKKPEHFNEINAKLRLTAEQVC